MCAVASYYTVEENIQNLLDYQEANDIEMNINQEAGEERITPLHMAAVSGSLKTVERLIEEGADIHATLTTGQTIMHSAANFCRGDMHNCEGAETCDHPFHTNFEEWVEGGIKIIRLLHKLGVDVNVAPNGFTPLFFASEYTLPVLLELYVSLFLSFLLLY